MDLCHEFVGVSGDDAEGLKPTAIRRLPCVPQPGKGERDIILHPERVRLLRLLIEPHPLIKAICRHEAASFLKRCAPRGAGLDSFSISVDSRNSLHV